MIGLPSLSLISLSGLLHFRAGFFVVSYDCLIFPYVEALSAVVVRSCMWASLPYPGFAVQLLVQLVSPITKTAKLSLIISVAILLVLPVSLIVRIFHVLIKIVALIVRVGVGLVTSDKSRLSS